MESVNSSRSPWAGEPSYTSPGLLPRFKSPQGHRLIQPPLRASYGPRPHQLSGSISHWFPAPASASPALYLYQASVSPPVARTGTWAECRPNRYSDRQRQSRINSPRCRAPWSLIFIALCGGRQEVCRTRPIRRPSWPRLPIFYLKVDICII